MRLIDTKLQPSVYNNCPPSVWSMLDCLVHKVMDIVHKYFNGFLANFYTCFLSFYVVAKTQMEAQVDNIPGSSYLHPINHLLKLWSILLH